MNSFKDIDGKEHIFHSISSLQFEPIIDIETKMIKSWIVLFDDSHECPIIKNSTYKKLLKLYGIKDGYIDDI